MAMRAQHATLSAAQPSESPGRRENSRWVHTNLCMWQEITQKQNDCLECHWLQYNCTPILKRFNWKRRICSPVSWWMCYGMASVLAWGENVKELVWNYEVWVMKHLWSLVRVSTSVECHIYQGEAWVFQTEKWWSLLSELRIVAGQPSLNGQPQQFNIG